MRKRIATWVTLTVGLVAILAMTLAALYLAHRQSLREESGIATAMTSELLQRADEMGLEAVDSYRQLDRAHLADPCSDAGLALMRDIGMKAIYLQAVGYVRDDRLQCSSFGRYAQGLPLGPVAYVTRRGTRVRPAVDLGQGKDRRFLVFELEHYAAAMHASAMLDIFTDRPEVSLGLYGTRSSLPLAVRGTFDPAWTKRIGDAGHVVFFDGRYLVAMQRSSKFDLTSYSAIPVSQLNKRLNQQATVLLPLGLLFGFGLSLAVYFLARQQNSMPAILRLALKRREFTLHYQPIITLKTGNMAGVEALLRWPRMEGQMRPDQFIRIAEECGLIRQFTTYVLAQLAIDAPRYLARHPDCYISVNLSPADLHDGGIIESLERLIATPGIPAASIMVELTEHSFLNTERASPTIEAIRALGIRVAIDDFGTGFSNLSQLAKLKVDCLKIDKVFVDTVGTDAATAEVALHIIQMAESLELTVIGEGIETEEQAGFLRSYGVGYGQGWLYARAKPMPEIMRDQARNPDA